MDVRSHFVFVAAVLGFLTASISAAPFDTPAPPPVPGTTPTTPATPGPSGVSDKSPDTTPLPEAAVTAAFVSATDVRIQWSAPEKGDGVYDVDDISTGQSVRVPEADSYTWPVGPVDTACFQVTVHDPGTGRSSTSKVACAYRTKAAIPPQPPTTTTRTTGAVTTHGAPTTDRGAGGSSASSDSWWANPAVWFAAFLLTALVLAGVATHVIRHRRLHRVTFKGRPGPGVVRSGPPRSSRPR
jgi:hypothetical protein